MVNIFRLIEFKCGVEHLRIWIVHNAPRSRFFRLLFICGLHSIQAWSPKWLLNCPGSWKVIVTLFIVQSEQSASIQAVVRWMLVSNLSIYFFNEPFLHSRIVDEWSMASYCWMSRMKVQSMGLIYAWSNSSDLWWLMFRNVTVTRICFKFNSNSLFIIVQKTWVWIDRYTWVQSTPGHLNL
jgi:hypothetical protein